MNNNLKKILTCATALLMISALAACGTTPGSSSSSSISSGSSSSTPSSSEPAVETKPEVADPVATAKKYSDAIVAARDEEMNKYNPIFTNDKASAVELIKKGNAEFTDEAYDSQLEMMLPMLGVTAADMESYAFSASMMNIKAYGIAVVKPVAGKEAAVEAGLNAFLETQKKNFETYLADQYEIAKAGTVTKLEDGTFVMVISENGAAINDAIIKSLTE